MARKKPFSDSSLFDASDVGVSAKLADKFIVPPFTILDGRQSYWMERKRQWVKLGVLAEEGKGHLGSTVVKTEWMQRGESTGGSTFDPVLAELVYRWFCPAGGTVLDPFAGEATKGVISGALGHPYFGIELRQGQVDANRGQWGRVAANLGPGWSTVDPVWACGDSSKLSSIVGEAKFDLVFTSPPYYDLEIYSKLEKDGSAFETYDMFMAWYCGIFRQAVAALKGDRFLVVKIGDVRDKQGFYYNFLGDNLRCFTDLGLGFYNEAVLVTPVGSLPIRTSRQFKSFRKLGRGHQNVLVFFKGNVKNIPKLFPEDVESGDA